MSKNAAATTPSRQPVGGGRSSWRPTRRMALLMLGGAAVLPQIVKAQSVDVRGRGYDPLWRNVDEAIEAFFGAGPYLREGARLLTPDYVDNGGSVAISVAIDAQMTPRDYPQVVHILAHGNPNPQVVSVRLSPESGLGAFSTRIRLERSQRLTLVAQMSDGRLLRDDVDVEIATGACADDGVGAQQDIADFRPVSRVSAPDSARVGEVVTVRALISHPMETGLRLNELDDWVRQRIISSFTCAYDGIPVFRARLYPSVSANPFFEFHCRATRTAPLDFTWYDTTDLTFVNQTVLNVS